MNPRWAATAVLLLGLGPLAGCVLLPHMTPIDPSGQPPLRSTGKELPPAQAAELSWTAAEALREKGLEAEALLQYERVRHFEPNHPRLAWKLALLYDRQGNTTRADLEYRRALKDEPRNPDLLNDLGYFHYQREQFDEAAQWFRKALAINARHRRASINLGKTLAHQGRIQESLECFGRAVPAAEAHCNVGVMLANASRTAEARAQFQQALRLEPTLIQAKTFLAWLDGPPPMPPVQLGRPRTGR